MKNPLPSMKWLTLFSGVIAVMLLFGFFLMPVDSDVKANGKVLLNAEIPLKSENSFQSIHWFIKSGTSVKRGMILGEAFDGREKKPVVAPISGRAIWLLEASSFGVNRCDTVAMLVSDLPLIALDVPERKVGLVKEGQSAAFRLNAESPTSRNVTMPTKVIHLDCSPVFADGQICYTVYAEMTEKGADPKELELLNGMSGRAFIRMGVFPLYKTVL